MRKTPTKFLDQAFIETASPLFQQLNAARSAFLSEEEKNQLVNEIKNKWPN